MKALKSIRMEEEHIPALLASAGGNCTFTEAVEKAVIEFISRHNIGSYDLKDKIPTTQLEFWLRATNELQQKLKDFARLFGFSLNNVRQEAFLLYIQKGKVDIDMLYTKCNEKEIPKVVYEKALPFEEVVK